MKFASGYFEQEHKFERKGKIDKEALANAVLQTPDAYLKELAEPFNCTEQAVFYALKKLPITYKRNVYLQREVPSEAAGVFR